ncbi:MAG: hypothetical protein JWQ02_1021 [Capsulimonas sp.]|nr:hypothetical protein [Capsulimonas sp.]
MAFAKIEMTFDEGQSFSPPPMFRAGQVVRGLVTVTPNADVECRHLWVTLQWRTEGRGERETGVAQKEDIFQGRLTHGTPVQIPFQFTLPQSPWSYSGKYVSIVWEVAVDVDVPWKVNPRGALPFILTGASGTPASAPAPNEARAIPTTPMPVNTPPPFAAPQKAQGGVDIVLQGVTGSENQVMQAMRQELPRLSLQEIQDMINAAPSVLLENAAPEDAQSIAARLTAAGAAIQILPHPPEAP